MVISSQRFSFARKGQLHIGIVGCGHNTRARLLPALTGLPSQFRLAGADLQPPPAGTFCFPVSPVPGADDLRRWLKDTQPDVVIIETPCDCHPVQLRLALEAGVRLILCEKLIASSSADAADVVQLSESAEPSQQVRYIDHYLLLDLVQRLLQKAPRLLGEVTFLKMALLETEGIPPDQERSHFQGMANFVHHGVALACRLFEPGLEVAAGAWARHSDARVPDTYRRVWLRSPRNGHVVADAAAGKYMPCGRKRIQLKGTDGLATLDREHGTLRIGRRGEPDEVVRGPIGDTGYQELARALAEGALPDGLLSPRQALEVLRLIEKAREGAREADVYAPASSAGAFVCDWEIPRPSRPMKKLAVITHDQVNEDRLRSVVEDCGDVFCSRWLRDPPPDGEFDAVLIDWDSLDPEGREKMLSALLAKQHRPPMGLYSYNVDPADAAILARKGIAVLDRLEPDAMAWLLNGA